MTTLFEPVIDVAHRPFCGPFAISALTGVPLSRIEKMIRRKRKGYRDSRGRRIPIKGTYAWEVCKILRRLGCKVTPIKVSAQATLSRFCADMEHVGPCLVEVTGHFVAIGKGLICDGSTGSAAIPWADYRKPGRRVRQAWRVEAPAAPLHGPAKPATEVPARKPRADIKAVRYARVLARVKVWRGKLRRAQTALRKLAVQRRYYERTSSAAVKEKGDSDLTNYPSGA